MPDKGSRSVLKPAPRRRSLKRQLILGSDDHAATHSPISCIGRRSVGGSSCRLLALVIMALVGFLALAIDVGMLAIGSDAGGSRLRTLPR